MCFLGGIDRWHTQRVAVDNIDSYLAGVDEPLPSALVNRLARARLPEPGR
jgi:hypothetical protein